MHVTNQPLNPTPATASRMRLTPIHPFPARMAPEIILERLSRLPEGATVLDPMSGSGTVLRASVEAGLNAVGFDADPLAVLMANVWSKPIKPGLSAEAQKIIAGLSATPGTMPAWHSSCEETAKFARFWFEERQYSQLTSLANTLIERTDEYADPLRLALSRVIITKEKGASIARDTSHSRPHRVFFENDFDVFRNFVLAAKRIEDRHKSEEIKGQAEVQLGDARHLPIGPGSVDAVITSPPYLNAIDYMRGHRLALIWLGHSVRALRSVRSQSIGTEMSLNSSSVQLAERLPDISRLSGRARGMVDRYALDISALMKEIQRVLRPNGQVLVVVGNSTIKDVNVSNADINIIGAEAAGLALVERTERDLPTASRYLPITGDPSALSKRMRTETVLTFSH